MIPWDDKRLQLFLAQRWLVDIFPFCYQMCLLEEFSYLCKNDTESNKGLSNYGARSTRYFVLGLGGVFGDNFSCDDLE